MTEDLPTPILGKILSIGGFVITILAGAMGIGAGGYQHAFGSTVAPWIALGGIMFVGLGVIITISYWTGYGRAEKDIRENNESY